MARRKDRPTRPLDARSDAILRAIIDEYVVTAAPVASQALVERRRLNVSSATVRNVMAELERAGYLRQPHTSAGRVPTDAGYRLHVESIEPWVTLQPVEQLMIRHQFGQLAFASEQWFRLAASTLAGSTGAAGIATPAKPSACRIKRVDLLTSGSRVASLVLVLVEGPVKQALLTLESPLSQEQLDAVARRLNRRFGGSSAREVERGLARLRIDPLDDVAHRAATLISRLMRDFDAAGVEELVSEGLLNVMEAPEFAQSEKLRRVFEALQNRAYLGELINEVTREGTVRIFIGAENRRDEMQEVSLILAPYGRPGRAVGVVGVLGPTRMAYPQAIGSVRYVSGLMNELVEDLYA